MISLLLQVAQTTTQAAQDGVTLSTGNVISLLSFFVTVLGIAVSVGYFKGKFEGVEKRVENMESEKKKELTEQGKTNNDYHTRLVKIESSISTMSLGIAEIKQIVTSIWQKP
jgi:predicted DNA repair protein MutK